MINPSTNKFVETGILKGPYTQCIPKFSRGIQPGAATPVSSPIPSIGSGYQMAIYRNAASGSWQLWIGDLSGLQLYSVGIPNPGFDSGTRLSAAGETHSPNHLNDMGIAGIRLLKWRDASGNWFSWNGMDFVRKDRPYQIKESSPYDGNSAQVSGNNGNPVPPNAPCP